MDLRLVPQLHFQSLDWSGFSTLANLASGALVYCVACSPEVSPGVLDPTLVPFRSSNMWFKEPPSRLSCSLRAWMEGRQAKGFRSGVGRISRWMVLSERNRGDGGSRRREPSERERRKPEKRFWMRSCSTMMLTSWQDPPSGLNGTCSSLAPPFSLSSVMK